MPHSESGEPQPQQQKVEIWVAPEPVPDLTAQAAPDTFKKVVAFLVASKDLEEPTTDHERVQAGLKKFQRTKGLPETGVYDASTKDAMNLATRWCGVPDTKASFVLGGGRWDHTALTYSFSPFTIDRTQESCRRIVQAAANLWARISPLTFSEVPSSGPADIRIRWVTGDHGDGLPFPPLPPLPTSGPAAHSFGPPLSGTPATELAGDIHFNEDVYWGWDTLLELTATHEFGHALGLAHSLNRRSVMYPGGFLPRDTLPHPDDIKGIHDIYGFRVPRWRRVPSQVTGAIVPRSLLAAGTTLFLLLKGPDCILRSRAPPHSQFSIIDSSVSNLQIASFDGDTLFSRALNGSIRRFSDSSGWENVDTDPNVVNIQVTPLNRLVKLRRDGSIEELQQEPTGAWRHTQLSGPSQTVQIVVDGTTGRILRRLRGGRIEYEQSRSFGPPSTWSLIETDPDVSELISVDTELFKLRIDGKLFRNNPAPTSPLTWEMIDNNPRTKHIVVANRDYVYQLWDDGSLYRYYGAGWEHLPSTTPPQTMQAVSFKSGIVYILERDGEVYKSEN